MIVVRSPLRIPICGGGTDLPSFYSKFGSSFVSAAINKYVYVSVDKPFVDKFRVKYSKYEEVDTVDQIQHDIVKAALIFKGCTRDFLEISSFASVPEGTGMGSSGAYTVALLKALSVYKNKIISNEQLAEEACDIEIEYLKRSVGKQDQYISALGGVTSFEIDTAGKVTYNRLPLKEETLHSLTDNLLLFYTGTTRNASDILKEQDDKSKASDLNMTENLKFVLQLGIAAEKALLVGDIPEFCSLINQHWQYKTQRSKTIASSKVNEAIDQSLRRGAQAAKLIGAGGGGFILVYAEVKDQVRQVMKGYQFKELRFNWDHEGTKVLIS